MLELLFRKKNQKINTTGIRINENSERNQSENRAFTLFAKALIVFYIVGGTFGAYLSAINVDCNIFAIEVVLLIVSLFTAFLYYSAVSENVGYIILLFIMASCGAAFRTYINSGYYSVLNKLNEKTAVYFDSNAIRVYNVSAGDNPAYVTIAIMYIGAVCCIITNIAISRRMRIWLCAAISLFLLSQPLYIGLEPSGVFVVMLLTGFFLAVIIKRGGHYRLHRQNNKYEYKKEKYTYVYSSKTLFETWFLVLAPAIAVMTVVALLFPGDSFHKGVRESEFKTKTSDIAQNLMIYGISSFFNSYENSGGLSSGRLGGVSSVRLDYETDLTVTYVPVSEGRMYLRHFVGGIYQPYENRWAEDAFVEKETAESVKGFAESGDEFSGSGMMTVKNVAAEGGGYVPYFCTDDPSYQLAGSKTDYTYYRTFASLSEVASSKYALHEEKDLNDRERGLCLLVPEDNLAALDKIIEDAGLDPEKSPPQNAMLLAAYYQAEIPYTYRPGYTPYKKDFVNYFLLENRRGYCSHFASAATLIFRRLGIPARYVEGYVVDAGDIVEEGTIRSDLNPADYYSGYKPLDETAVVDVNISDSGAHAWLEMWIEGIGWQIVDITPASTEQADANIWSMFMNFFRGETPESTVEENTITDTDATDPGTGSRAILVMFEIVLVAALFCFMVVLAYRFGKRYVSTWNAVRKRANDRVIYRYSRYIAKIAKKNEKLASCINYTEQTRVLTEDGFIDPEASDRMLDILQRAGFSDREISKEDENWIYSVIKNKRKKG